MAGQRLYDCTLAPGDLPQGGFDVEPCGPVDLGKAPALAGPRRPFHFEEIAGDRGFVDVGLYRKCDNSLAAGLTEFAKQGKVTLDRGSGLLVKFAPGGGERILALVEEALGDGPGGIILPRPKRSAGMAEENFDAGPSVAISQDAGAALWHGQDTGFCSVSSMMRFSSSRR